MYLGQPSTSGDIGKRLPPCDHHLVGITFPQSQGGPPALCGYLSSVWSPRDHSRTACVQTPTHGTGCLCSAQAAAPVLHPDLCTVLMCTAALPPWVPLREGAVEPSSPTQHKQPGLLSKTLNSKFWPPFTLDSNSDYRPPAKAVCLLAEGCSVTSSLRSWL